MTRVKDATLAKSISKEIKNHRQKMFPGHGGQGRCIEKYGASREKWSQWERGVSVPTDPEQRRLAEFFGISLAELRGDYSQPPQNIERVPEERSADYWRGVAEERLTFINQLKAENKQIREEKNAEIARLLRVIEGITSHPAREGTTPGKAAAG